MTPLVISIGIGALLTLVAGRALASRPAPPPGKALSRQFDPVFAALCPGIPRAFLRALAKNESNFDPAASRGPAWGLLQVVELVRRDYNQRLGASVSRQDLLDPSTNVRIACELLSRIAASYVRNHPRTFPRIDWRDLRFVGLVVFGWNAGYSEAAGVGHLIGQLERKGTAAGSIDIYLVHAAAVASPKASRFLRMSQRLAWTNRVVSDYAAELRREEVVS